MTPERLKEIRDKITKVNNTASKAEGAIDQIKARWQKEFNVNTVEEAEKLSDKYASEIESHKEKRQILVDKLENLTDWSVI